MRMSFKRSELWGPSLANVWSGNYASEKMRFKWGGDHAMSMVYKGLTQTGRRMRVARYMVPIEGETQRVTVEDRAWEVSKRRYASSAYGQKDIRLQGRRGLTTTVAPSVTLERAKGLLNEFQAASIASDNLQSIGRATKDLHHHVDWFASVVPSAV